MLNWWPIAIILIFSNGADILTGWHATRNRMSEPALRHFASRMTTQDVVTSKRASIGRGQHYFHFFCQIHEFCKCFNIKINQLLILTYKICSNSKHVLSNAPHMLQLNSTLAGRRPLARRPQILLQNALAIRQREIKLGSLARIPIFQSLN